MTRVCSTYLLDDDGVEADQLADGQAKPEHTQHHG